MIDFIILGVLWVWGTVWTLGRLDSVGLISRGWQIVALFLFWPIWHLLSIVGGSIYLELKKDGR